MQRAVHRRARARALLALLSGLVAGALAACARKESSELEIQLPAPVPEGLSFRWHRVSGADAYRLVFSRSTGAPVCTVFVDQQKRPTFLLARDSLPRGLAHGWQLDLEVTAMRHGVAMPIHGMRPLEAP